MTYIKSKLDLLVERRVLTEKYSIASMAIEVCIQAQLGRFHLSTELDYNKFCMISYVSDEKVDIYIVVILRNIYLHRNLVDDAKKTINYHNEDKQGFNISSVEEFKNNYTMFAYKATIGGSVVLDAMIKDAFINSLTIEALKVEKQLLDYRR